MLPWLVSILVAVISGGVSLLLGGFIANACVAWFQISSREGASGYFVVFIALCSAIAGLIVGLLVARIVVATSSPGFGKELLCALGVVIFIAGAAALTCRMLADIPPTIDGRELTLQVDFRLPNTLDLEKSPLEDSEWAFNLASLAGRTRRVYRDGTIQLAGVRVEEGRWIVPAQVELFTQRGGRLVTLSRLNSTEILGFLIPLPARPGAAFQHWSQWMPIQQVNGQPWPSDKMSYRFRVQKTPIND